MAHYAPRIPEILQRMRIGTPFRPVKSKSLSKGLRRNGRAQTAPDPLLHKNAS
jgi:hypothetical protein